MNYYIEICTYSTATRQMKAETTTDARSLR